MSARNLKKENGPIEIAFKDRKHYSESYSYGLEYSLLTPKYKAVHPPVLCKDFLTDIFWSEYTNKRIQIYGFSWTPGRFAINRRKFHLGIRLRHRGNDAYDNLECPRLQEFLNEFEALVDVPLSKVYVVSDTAAIVEFDREWTMQPIRLSLYTLLVRVGLRYDGRGVEKWLTHIRVNGNGEVGSYDSSIVKAAESKFNGIFKHKSLSFLQEYKDYKGSSVHDESGLMSWKEKWDEEDLRARAAHK